MDKAWDLLFDELLVARQELTRRICEAIRDQLPIYRTIPRDALDAEVDREVTGVLEPARSGRAPGAAQELAGVLTSARDGRTSGAGPELADLVAIGEARAQQGLPVADMLAAWRIGIQIVISYGRELGVRLGVSDALLLDFVQSALVWSDAAMITTTDAHRRTEVALALADETRRAAFVRGALFGTVPSAQLRIQAEAYGLDPAGEFMAVRARLDDGDSAHDLQQALEIDPAGQSRCGLTTLVDGDIGGFLCKPPPKDIHGVVGFGPPVPLESLAESHRLAVRALMTANACGFEGAYDISALGLRVAVAVDKDVSRLLRCRYLESLEAGGSAQELLETLRAYLACRMHVRRTAMQLFVHENTVRYRLARFEELTGASLLDPEVLSEVWWVIQLSEMRL